MRLRGAVTFGLALVALTAPTAGHPASAAATADPAVDAWRSWPFEASCYSRFDPVEVFSGPANAEQGSAPAEVALREITATQVFPPLPDDGWRRGTETDTEATFVHGLLGGPFGPLWVRLEKADEVWKWAGSGTCPPRTTLHGLGAATWTLDAAQPPLGPNTRRLLVDLGPGPCSSGMGQNERARKPIFRQFGKRLAMIILLEPLPPGFYTCQGVIEPPLKVKLPSRLGPRALFDGGSFPPLRAKPAGQTASRSARLRQ